jgi:hypothetical protein
LPAEARAASLEVYDVLLRLRLGSREMELVRFERQVRQASPAPWRLETALPDDGSYLWGIVAVEPASNAVYLRRLRVRPEPAPAGAAAGGAAGPGL